MATGWWAEKVLAVPAATATAAALAPAVAASSLIAVPAATAVAGAPTPVVSAVVAVAVPAASATVAAPTPDLAFSSTITPPAAAATATAPTPVVSAGTTLAVPAATATADALAPAWATAVTITPPAASATADAAVPVIKKVVSHTWAGTTLGPFATSKWQCNSANNAGLSSGDISVSGGIAREGNSSANNGTYWSGRCHKTPMGTVLHFAQVTLPASLTGLDRGQGCGVGGSDSSFTNGVFVIVDTAANATALQIFSKVGNTVTPRVSANNPNGTPGGAIGLQITHNGSNYVYTVFENGVSTGSAWSDTGGIITPGLWVTPAFERTYAAGQFGSEGLAAFAAADN